jgi:hypothetical protein
MRGNPEVSNDSSVNLTGEQAEPSPSGHYRRNGVPAAKMSGGATARALGIRDKFYFTMLSLDDKRWQILEGGYRTRFDPRPLFSELETDKDAKAAWHELWEGLHHQGDVGAASYAAVPHLVRIYRKRGVLDWNTYAIVAVIELARDDGKNPEVPRWLEDDYFQAIRDLAEVGAVEVLQTKNPEEIRAILSILAISAGARTHAKFLIDYSAEELLEMERLASEVEP